MSLNKWPYAGSVQSRHLATRLKENTKKLSDTRYDRYVNALKATEPLARKLKNKINSKASENGLIKIKDNKVCIAPNIQLSDPDKKILNTAIQNMVPWRKGPFECFGQSIDAEWRSDLKWQRVKKHVGSLQGKVILDIGCNNGYYLYHMAKQNPKYLLGIDPVIPFYLQFQLLNQFCPNPNMDFKLLGVQDLVHFEKVFDVVFCMGILYHHPDPIGILRTIFQSMRPGGLLIVESQGINQTGPYCLFPKNRYLNMPGHWFIPSREALENMVRRSGFQYVETFLELELSQEEQRRTEQAPFESLKDGLDANNDKQTAEGYPAPWRFYLKARRARKRK